MHLVAAHGRDAELWTTALARFRQADIYYTPEYARAYEGFSEGKAYAFVLTEGDAAVIHPVMIRDIAVLPFARAPVRGSGDATPRCDLITPYGYGGPLASAEDPQARERLLSEFDRGFHDMCRTLGAVSEFVRFHPLLETQSGMGERLDLTRRGETVWLSITADEDAMMAAMSPAGRNKIRRARREGVTVSAESGLEAIRVLTSLYHETLGRLGAPRSY